MHVSIAFVLSCGIGLGGSLRLSNLGGALVSLYLWLLVGALVRFNFGLLLSFLIGLSFSFDVKHAFVILTKFG